MWSAPLPRCVGTWSTAFITSFLVVCLFVLQICLMMANVLNVFDEDVSFLRTPWNGFGEVNHTLKLRPVINTEAI